MRGGGGGCRVDLAAPPRLWRVCEGPCRLCPYQTCFFFCSVKSRYKKVTSQRPVGFGHTAGRLRTFLQLNRKPETLGEGHHVQRTTALPVVVVQHRRIPARRLVAGDLEHGRDGGVERGLPPAVVVVAPARLHRFG